MTAAAVSQEEAGLVFKWDRPGRRKLTIAGFLLASLALHAACFYLFQIIYPPAVALLPPPGRVSLIGPATDEGRVLLRWIEAEDPALASTTEPPPNAKSVTMPALKHTPSYLSHQPALKEVPSYVFDPGIPSAQPPAPVPRPRTVMPDTPINVATTVRFSVELDALGPAQYPKMKFTASSNDAPEVAQFRVAANRNGEVRYCFLLSSSGDRALDEQARRYVALCRFGGSGGQESQKEEADPVWASAIVEWGNDIAEPGPSSRTVTP